MFKEKYIRPIRNSFKKKGLLRAKLLQESVEDNDPNKSITEKDVNRKTENSDRNANISINIAECRLPIDAIEIASEGLEKLRALHILVSL
jgi:hypothetical protein